MKSVSSVLSVAVAIAASAAIVFGSPYVGELRGAILLRFPEQYRLIIGGIVFAATATLVLVAVIRIREHRAPRYAALGGSLAIGGGVAWAFRTGNANVDVVEAFHFVEYGIVTLLFYRVWRARGGISAIAYPMLACIAVGTLDEWVQWFVPERTGELRDIALNGVSAICGILFAVALDPPEGSMSIARHESCSLLGASAALVTLLVAAFVSTVHLGYELHDPEIGSFRSRNSTSELESPGRDRLVRGREEARASAPRFSREDQYLSEGIWHVRRRNKAFEDGDIAVAWRENRILEKYYLPVLERSSGGEASRFRWPAEQRADAEARAGHVDRPFTSDANPYPIYAWSKSSFWAGIGVLASLVFGAGLYADRRRAGRSGPAAQSIHPPPTTTSPS